MLPSSKITLITLEPLNRAAGILVTLAPTVKVIPSEVEREELLEISASLCESAPDLTPPDAELLFEMSEKTMDRYLEQSYVDRLLAVWTKYYGQ